MYLLSVTVFLHLQVESIKPSQQQLCRKQFPNEIRALSRSVLVVVHWHNNRVDVCAGLILLERSITMLFNFMVSVPKVQNCALFMNMFLVVLWLSVFQRLVEVFVICE